MASTQITFDKLVYIDRLKSAGVDEPVPPDLADVRGQPVARRALEMARAA